VGPPRWRGGLVCAATALVLGATLPARVREMRAGVATAFLPERAAAAAARGATRQRGVLFCMQSVVEVLSGLPPERVKTWHPVHVDEGALRRAAARFGTAVAVLPPARAEALAGVGSVVSRGDRYVVLRVP